MGEVEPVMTVPECEVCFDPDPVIKVTFESETEDPCVVDVCHECAKLMFGAMVERYKLAVDGVNDAVRAMYRLFGIEAPI